MDDAVPNEETLTSDHRQSLLRCIATFAVPCSGLMILSDATPAPAVATHSFSRTLHSRSDAFARGAGVLLPALDSRWLEGRSRPIVLLVAFAVVAIIALLVASAAHLTGQ